MGEYRNTTQYVPVGPNPGSAFDNCRVSCRSCKQAEDEYKVRNTRENLEGVTKFENWKRVWDKVKVTKTAPVTKTITVSVMTPYPMSEVCTSIDGQGNNIKKPD